MVSYFNSHFNVSPLSVFVLKPVETITDKERKEIWYLNCPGSIKEKKEGRGFSKFRLNARKNSYLLIRTTLMIYFYIPNIQLRLFPYIETYKAFNSTLSYVFL